MGASRARRSHTHFTGTRPRAFEECDDLREPWCELTWGWDETAGRGARIPLTDSDGFQKVGRKRVERGA